MNTGYKAEWVMLSVQNPAALRQPSGMPRFGCRLFAFMTESKSPGPEQDRLVRELLLDNPNAIKLQSAPRVQHPLQWLFTNPISRMDILKRALKGNGDGWGVAAYPENAPVFHKVSMKAAHTDKQYDAAVGDLIQQHPRTFMVHLLKNGEGRSPDLRNLHPFVYQQWTGMLNGGLKGALRHAWKQINEQYGPVLGTVNQGTTSGEAGFYLFLGRMKEQYGTVNTEEIGLENVRQGFAQMAQEMLVRSQCIFEPFENVLEGGPYLGAPKGSANFIFSDGQHVFAFRHGRTLFLGRRTLADGTHEVMVASEPSAPSSYTRGLVWTEIPEDTVVVLSRDKNGRIGVTFNHLEEIVPPLPL